MNEGVKILIDRMESNPEDFEDRDFEPNTGRITRGKFKGVADVLKKRLSGERPAWDAMNVLSTEEIEALTAAYVKMERKKFTNGIMAKLLEEDKLDSLAYTAGPFTTGPLTTSVGFNGSSATVHPNIASNTGTVSIAPTKGGPAFDFNDKSIIALNEMVKKWRGEEDGAI
jgi:hypothetical protein